MQDKFYFTQPKAAAYASNLIDAMEVQLTNCEYSDKPDTLNDGVLYQVTIKQVGRVRTTKEVEFDPSEQEESD